MLTRDFDSTKFYTITDVNDACTGAFMLQVNTIVRVWRHDYCNV